MSCLSLVQKSVEWCEGAIAVPGVLRRIYYINKNDIVSFPTYSYAGSGEAVARRPTSGVLSGNFVLAESKKWKHIDILPDKSQLTSEAQGEYPSQTQLNKLTAVHPGVGVDAQQLALSCNNVDNVYLVEVVVPGETTSTRTFRVLGNEMWPTKTTVAQDLGQGATGATSTTLNVEVPDLWLPPFYTGEVVTEEGTINGSSTGD